MPSKEPLFVFQFQSPLDVSRFRQQLLDLYDFNKPSMRVMVICGAGLIALVFAYGIHLLSGIFPAVLAMGLGVLAVYGWYRKALADYPADLNNEAPAVAFFSDRILYGRKTFVFDNNRSGIKLAGGYHLSHMTLMNLYENGIFIQAGFLREASNPGHQGECFHDPYIWDELLIPVPDNDVVLANEVIKHYQETVITDELTTLWELWRYKQFD